MFLSALVTVILVPLVLSQTDQLDQECHILQTLDDLQNRLTAAEHEVATIKSGRATDMTEIANLKSSLTNAETQVTNLKTSLTSTETQMTNLRATLETEITTVRESLTTAENKIHQQAMEITTLQDSLATAETDIAELQTSLRETSQTPSVLFNVRDISPQPTANNIIHFQTVIENVGDGYNVTSGCFTAPARGRYWFSGKICTHVNRYIAPSLIIKGTVASRAWVRDVDLADCGSVTAVATLEVGDTVCLKSGPVQSTDPVGGSVDYITNNFMGAILN